jgi:hypothetical protein
MFNATITEKINEKIAHIKKIITYNEKMMIELREINPREYHNSHDYLVRDGKIQGLYAALEILEN